jgi:hypothetical protein
MLESAFKATEYECSSEAADVWACGLLLCHMFFGRVTHFRWGRRKRPGCSRYHHVGPSAMRLHASYYHMPGRRHRLLLSHARREPAPRRLSCHSFALRRRKQAW